VSARIRAGSTFTRFLYFVLIYVRCLRIPLLKTTGLENVGEPRRLTTLWASTSSYYTQFLGAFWEPRSNGEGRYVQWAGLRYLKTEWRCYNKFKILASGSRVRTVLATILQNKRNYNTAQTEKKDVGNVASCGVMPQQVTARMAELYMFLVLLNLPLRVGGSNSEILPIWDEAPAARFAGPRY
jgi:hypothetical protein